MQPKASPSLTGLKGFQRNCGCLLSPASRQSVVSSAIDFFRNKEGSYQAQQSRRRFWLVLVADSHANPQVMQSHGDHGQGITHSGPRIAQNISDTAVSLEPSIAVFNADPS